MEKLNKSEWMVVISLLILIGTITTASHRDWSFAQLKQKSNPIDLYQQEINVMIQGAVEYPGNYTFPKGATVGDLLEKSKPKPQANLSKVILLKKLRDGQIIRIPALTMLTVKIKGAVTSPGELMIPKGTRLMDLLEIVKFDPEADINALESKRKLKEGEIVYIPKQKKS